MNKDQVLELFRSNYTEVTEAVGGELKVWRYDDTLKPDYTPEKTCCDTVDTDGMKKRNIKAQLFIVWNENNTVKDYSLIYYERINGKYVIKQFFANGNTQVLEEEKLVRSLKNSRPQDLIVLGTGV